MLSQTVEYALRAMIHLAARESGVTLTAEALAERTRVPQGYLSKVMRDLVVAELVHSQRGPRGGFTLARPPADITMLEVVNAVDPIRRITRCPLGNPAHVKLCPLHKRLDDALAMIEREFAQTTLAEILETSTRGSAQCRTLTMPTVRGKAPAPGATR